MKSKQQAVQELWGAIYQLENMREGERLVDYYRGYGAGIIEMLDDELPDELFDRWHELT